MAGISNVVHGIDTVTVIYAQFWLRPFRSDNFDIKDDQALEGICRRNHEND